jgi:hypothetical protein
MVRPPGDSEADDLMGGRARFIRLRDFLGELFPVVRITAEVCASTLTALEVEVVMVEDVHTKRNQRVILHCGIRARHRYDTGSCDQPP